MIFLGDSLEAQGLLTAAVHALARVRSITITTSTADAWTIIADACNRSTDELRRFRSTLSDEAIAAIAQVALTEGLLGLSWLQRWLQATDHPHPKQLADTLLIGGWPRANLTVRTNPRLTLALAQMSHDTDIARNAFPDILIALRRQASLVLLFGETGLGTTSLLLAAARHYYHSRADLPYFAYIVWVDLAQLAAEAQTNHPLSRSLVDLLLDEILLAAEVPRIIDLSVAQKEALVADILWSSPLLLVLDHFDHHSVIRNDQVRRLIADLPYPSKALVSTSDKPDPMFDSCYAIPLRNLDLTQQMRFLGTLERDFNLTTQESRSIYTRTNGNLRRAYLLAAYYVHTKQPLSETMTTDLQGLLKANFQLLSHDAQNIVLALIAFPSGFARTLPLYLLAAQADSWPNIRQPYPSIPTWFEEGVQELVKLHLVEQTSDDGLRWHVNAQMVATELFTDAGTGSSTSLPALDNLKFAWARLFVSFCQQIGYCPFELHLLEQLDDQMYVIPAVVNYLATQDTEHTNLLAIRLARGLSYAYYVRGFALILASPHRLGYEAAERMLLQRGPLPEHEIINYAIMDLSFEIEWLTKRANFNEIDRRQYWTTVSRLKQSSEINPLTLLIERSTYAFYLMYCPDPDFLSAQIILADVIEQTERVLNSSIAQDPMIDTHLYLRTFLDLAYYRLARCVSQHDPSLAIQIIEDTLARTPVDPRTLIRMLLLQTKLLLASSEADESASTDSLDTAGEKLSQITSHIARREHRSWTDLLSGSSHDPAKLNIMDPTELAHALAIYGYYLTLLRNFEGLTYLRNAIGTYRWLGRLTDVNETDAIYQRMHRHLSSHMT